jgi:hypothetical protein
MAEWVSGAALAAAVLALLYTWRLHKELDRATARLDRYNRALFDAGEELRQLRQQLGEHLPQGSAGQKAPNITLDLER